ncbi:MAG: peptidylprolyl isomerase [Pseudomonadota bacterium]
MLGEFDAFIRAGVTWRAFVQARFRRIATPTENDLDAALELASRGVQESVLLQELGMPFAERGEEETLALARRLSRELNRGGNFNAAVARYSRTPSAARGGRLDWLPANSLPPQVAAQVLALQKGEVTAPIPITRGVSMLKLLDIREEPLTDDGGGEVAVTYSQLIIPLSRNAADGAVNSARLQAEQIRNETELCRDLDARAEDFGVGSGRSEPTPVSAVPSAISLLLAQMDPGDIEIQEDARGVVLLMLCGRSDQTSPEEREALRSRLFNQRMNTLAQGYLQDLRGDAVIVER